MRISALPATFLTALLAVLVPGAASLGQEHHDHAPAAPAATLDLSPETGRQLSREMLAIQKGMQELVPAISAGNWSEITEIGRRIEASYILAQELTEAQQEELHDALPPAFLEMDQTFHGNAGRLAQASEARNAEVVTFYFFKLSEGCVTCHTRFAQERFPGLSPNAAGSEHHH